MNVLFVPLFLNDLLEFVDVSIFNGKKEVEVKNPNHVSKGVKSLVVDGKEVEGNVIPMFNDGKKHSVVATMG